MAYKTHSLIFLVALFAVGGTLFYLHHRPTHLPDGPMGTIGVNVKTTHAGVREAFTHVNSTVKKIITEELERIAPGCPFDISALYKSSNRCPITVAYLGNQNDQRMTKIQTSLIDWHKKYPVERGTFELSESLTFLGSQNNIIVLLLNDNNDCLYTLHRSLESCLATLGHDWYIPWRTVGAFIPHITIGKINFDTLRTIATQNGHSANLIVSRITQRVHSEIFARFQLDHAHKTVECNTFTLFNPQRAIVALCSLSVPK